MVKFRFAQNVIENMVLSDKKDSVNYNNDKKSHKKRINSYISDSIML